MDAQGSGIHLTVAVRLERTPDEQLEKLGSATLGSQSNTPGPEATCLTSLSLSFPICKLEATIATDHEESLSVTIYVKGLSWTSKSFLEQKNINKYEKVWGWYSFFFF